jgi:hypothetical protein
VVSTVDFESTSRRSNRRGRSLFFLPIRVIIGRMVVNLWSLFSIFSFADSSCIRKNGTIVNLWSLFILSIAGEGHVISESMRFDESIVSR